MAGVRDIRRRIRSVRNMQQITKAMKMVAAAKLRKAQTKVIAARPFTRQLQEILTRLAQVQTDGSHPLLEQREVKRTAYLLVTSDRGLAGAFNASLIRMTEPIIREAGDKGALIAVGRKGRDYFRRRKVDITADFTGLGDDPSYLQAQRIAQEVIRKYQEGQFDEVNLIYTEFVTAITQRPTQLKLLPVERPEEASSREYLFEPSAEDILNTLLPKYVENVIYKALLESKASEQGARMTAMGSATDNAKEMIDRLTLVMNRARQAAITKEISEIVGGAAALE